jgi:hypothetical protein
MTTVLMVMSGIDLHMISWDWIGLVRSYWFVWSVTMRLNGLMDVLLVRCPVEAGDFT